MRNVREAYLFVTLLVLIAISTQAHASTSFTMKERLVIDGSTVRLSDIVHEDLGDVRDIVLLQNLPWKSKKALSRNFVLNRSRSLDIELTGPIQIVVERLMCDRTGEIRDRLQAMIREKFAESKWSSTGSELDLELVNFPAMLMISPGEYSLDARFPGSVSNYQTISFTVRGIDGFKRRFSTGCRFHLMASCAVAVRAIGRKEIVSEGDIRWEERDLAACYKMPVTRAGDIIGMRIDRYVREGDLIDLSSIERIPDVGKGDGVLLEVARGVMVVSTRGVSLEDGFIGDTILVKNRTSGKIGRFKIVDKGKVAPVTMQSREDS